MGRLRYMAGWERAVPVIPLLLMLGAAGVAAQDPYLVIRQQPLPADCNGDSSVNIFDLVLVGRAFGAVSGEGGYGPQMDLNGDGVIDIFDLVLVGRAFGEDSITFVGEQVCVEAYVGNVTDLYAYRFDVLHDPGMLEVVSVSEGPFLGSDGASTSWSPPTVNGTAGTITGLAATRAGAPEGVSGSGQLVLICFRAMAHGTSALYLQNVTLWDAGEVGMPVEVYPGGVLVDSIIPVHPTDQDWNEGTTGHVVSWSVASPDELGGPYTVYRNGSYWSSGTWINATAFNVGVDACVPGVWNFTVEAGDSSRTATDTVYVAVRAIEPNSNEPPDQVWTWGTTGHAIVWVVTDPGSHAGDYLVYRNGTCLNPSGDVWANGTDIAWGIDGLGAGVWNFTIVFWDGNCTEPYPADLVFVTVEGLAPSVEMYLNGTAGSRVYLDGQVMNLTGTVLPGDLLVVVEFTDGTDISTPLEGVSTAMVPASQWGPGVYFVRAHTDGNASHHSADSPTWIVTIPGKPPTIDSPPDAGYGEGSAGNVVSWSVASPDELGGPYTVYRNGSYWSSGTWINATAFNVGVDACVPGVWNFTIDVGGAWGNVTDAVNIRVTPIPPTTKSPPDQVWTWGTTGHAIVWVVTDPGSHAGDYLVYRNGTCLNPSGDVWANGTDIAWGIDGLGAGVWNFTIVFWDGNCTEPYPADLVLVTVEKATPSLEMYLNGSPDDRDYFIWDVINLTGTVLPGDLLVVVEFTDGTDISTPLEGVSTAIVPAFQWGQGNYFVQAHTDGDANHTSADSARRRVRIVPWLQGDELSPSSYEGSLAGNEFPEAVTPADGGSGAGMTSPSGSPGTLGVSGAGTGADAPWGNPAWYLAVDEWERAAAPAERPAATTTSLELELHLQTS